MSIPATIATELASLQAQITAASPITSANRATLTAIRLNTANLVNDVQNALVAPNVLDTFVAPFDPPLIISGVLNLSTTGSDMNNLSLMRGIVGRVASNLAQLP